MVVSAGEIVNGREITMGNSECAYNGETHVIDCLLANGNSVRLDVKGAFGKSQPANEVKALERSA